MSPRRMQTGPPITQPVRFYKIVALSFLGLTILLLGAIVFMSSKRASITITTKVEPIDVTTTVGVNDGEQGRVIDGVVTSTIVVITESFEPTGTRTEPGIATGVVMLHNESSRAQPLVATTRLLASDGILFRMKQGETVPAKGTIEVAVYADQEGKSGNIGPTDRFTIPGLNENRQKEIYASSQAQMSGGVTTIGVLGQGDIDRAQTIVEDGLLSQGKELLASIVGTSTAVYVVTDVTVDTDAPLGEEVSTFDMTASGRVSLVQYDTAQLDQLMQDILTQRAIDESEQVTPLPDPPRVSVAEINLPKGTAFLDVTYSGTATINPESKQLSKLMFYGKTREEIRRYVLTLDHVFGVDVKFRPAWIQTVPHVPDHVQVVVKEVE